MGEREGDRGAEIKIGEVGGAKVGILRHHRIESNVDSSEGGDIGRGRTGGGETVTSRGAANATADIVSARERDGPGRRRADEVHFSFITRL